MLIIPLLCEVFPIVKELLFIAVDLTCNVGLVLYLGNKFFPVECIFNVKVFPLLQDFTPMPNQFIMYVCVSSGLVIKFYFWCFLHLWYKFVLMVSISLR